MKAIYKKRIGFYGLEIVRVLAAGIYLYGFGDCVYEITMGSAGWHAFMQSILLLLSLLGAFVVGWLCSFIMNEWWKEIEEKYGERGEG